MVSAAATITVFAVVLPVLDVDFTHPVVLIAAALALCGTLIAAVAIRDGGR